MDLDFKSVKALASPTRLEILNSVLDEEATTTKLSDNLGKSKSTVSSHLKVLTESGLLEKDKEEGRRRVVYKPTDKARAIVEGKERKVKFSVVSSALTAAGGLFFVNEWLTKKGGSLGAGSRIKDYAAKSQPDAMTTMQAPEASGGSGGMGAMSTEATNRTIEQGANATAAAAESTQAFQPEQAMLVIGIGLLVTSILAVGYAYILNRIRG